jgi:RNA polymerase sigma factor (sigma-70 family)
VNPRFLAQRRAPRAELLAPLTDEELAELIAQGHEQAFEALVARHRRVLVNHCSQLVGRADAEEAVQEALLRAYLSLSRGQSVQRVGAWLRTIAHNTALNLLRSRGARPMAGEHEPPDVATDPFERREHLRLVLEALGSLPKRQREALVMRELEGRSYAEIESRLRTSNGAVRQLLNRARARIRTRLSTLAGFEPAFRWIVGSGSPGSSALRLGALGGGCAVTVKLCAGALLPIALGPGHLTRPEAARAAPYSHAHAANAHGARAASGDTLASPVTVSDPVLPAHEGIVYAAYRPGVTRGRRMTGGGFRLRRAAFGGPAEPPKSGPWGGGSRGQAEGTSGGGEPKGTSTSAGGQTGGTSSTRQSWGGGQRGAGGADNGQRQGGPRGYAASGQGSTGSGGDASTSPASGDNGGTGSWPSGQSTSQPRFASSQWSATSSPGGSPSDSRPDEGALASSGAEEGLSSTAP